MRKGAIGSSLVVNVANSRRRVYFWVNLLTNLIFIASCKKNCILGQRLYSWFHFTIKETFSLSLSLSLSLKKKKSL